ncbi:MAG: hypothetical protein FWE51_01490 [Coriobacteriia bacterium]|nr:hypothetical protein [Coriobacteriia bacterium]
MTEINKKTGGGASPEDWKLASFDVSPTAVNGASGTDTSNLKCWVTDGTLFISGYFTLNTALAAYTSRLIGTLPEEMYAAHMAGATAFSNVAMRFSIGTNGEVYARPGATGSNTDAAYVSLVAKAVPKTEHTGKYSKVYWERKS